MPPVAAAFAAVAAGTATVAAVATVVGVIGAGTFVVGKITGNEKLQKIGKVMAIVGGGVAIMSGAAGGSAAMSSAAAGSSATGAGGAAAEYAAGIGASSSGAGSQAAMLAGQTAEFGTAGLAATTQAASTAGAAGGMSIPNLVNAGSSLQGVGGLLGGASEHPSDLVGGLQKDNLNLPSGNRDKGWWDSLAGADKLALLKFGGETVTGMVAGWKDDQKQDFERERLALMQGNANAQPNIQYQQQTNVSSRPVGGLLNATQG